MNFPNKKLIFNIFYFHEAYAILTIIHPYKDIILGSKLIPDHH